MPGFLIIFSMSIIHLVTTQAALLLVYRTSNSLYAYQILFGDGSVYTPQELYYHASTALKVGRERINIVTDYPA